MTKEAVEERAEGFPRFSHFSHVENSQDFFSENLLFGSGLFLTSKNVNALLLFMT